MAARTPVWSAPANAGIMPKGDCNVKVETCQGNCIKLGQTHVRLPESGRGAPCGRPSQGITPGTVQIVVRYRKFHTSLATGGRFLGRQKKTIGRGAPCGRPSSAILASELRCDCPERHARVTPASVAAPERVGLNNSGSQIGVRILRAESGRRKRGDIDARPFTGCQFGQQQTGHRTVSETT